MASGTSQAVDTVVVSSSVMCTDLPESRVASGVGPAVLCPKLFGASKPREGTFGKLPRGI